MKVRIKENYLAIKSTMDFTGVWAQESEISLYPGMEFEAEIIKDYGMFVDFELKLNMLDYGVRYERVSKRVFDELYEGQLSIGD